MVVLLQEFILGRSYKERTFPRDSQKSKVVNPSLFLSRKTFLNPIKTIKTINKKIKMTIITNQIIILTAAKSICFIFLINENDVTFIYYINNIKKLRIISIVNKNHSANNGARVAQLVRALVL